MKNALIIILVVALLAAVGAAAYFFGKSQGVKNEASSTVVSPTITSEPVSPTTEATPTAQVTAQGTVTGKLCYPSSMIPPGKIVAKDVSSSKIYSQDYAGTQAGAGMTYTFSLPVGSYHLKFDGQFSKSTVTGYYTTYSPCVGNPSGADCSGQKTRPLLDAQVKAGATLTDVNLCDFYYPPDAPPSF